MRPWLCGALEDADADAAPDAEVRAFLFSRLSISPPTVPTEQEVGAKTALDACTGETSARASSMESAASSAGALVSSAARQRRGTALLSSFGFLPLVALAARAEATAARASAASPVGREGGVGCWAGVGVGWVGW